VTIAHYDRLAEAYWDGTRDHDVTQNYAALLDAIEGDSPYSILDLGCGPGRDLRYFRSLGHDVVGLDGSTEFVAMARSYSGCEVLQQDFLAMALPESRFDGIFANASLFHESIGANLLYARPGASKDELVAACQAARIHETIAALPDGYRTIVGERGYRLSGGEKQRVAIARLLLKNPAIMVLDEATSHLDNENEALVQAALDAALAGRTAIVIAHRLSTIRNADRIVVLHEGRIVEQGTHAELAVAGGYYSELYRKQLLEEELEAI